MKQKSTNLSRLKRAGHQHIQTGRNKNNIRYSKSMSICSSVNYWILVQVVYPLTFLVILTTLLAATSMNTPSKNDIDRQLLVSHAFHLDPYSSCRHPDAPLRVGAE
mmetsp:Transcript_10627/g.16171  ORF Transcript_10627/g.16171 Transcript_10627/m.16171 type:complete len:106 (-) Transcript_10627:17-334(-)